MSKRVIGHRLFTDGLTRPVYEYERGQFIVEDGSRCVRQALARWVVQLRETGRPPGPSSPAPP
jgi:hypothetical protein